MITEETKNRLDPNLMLESIEEQQQILKIKPFQNEYCLMKSVALETLKSIISNSLLKCSKKEQEKKITNHHIISQKKT